LVCRVFFVIPLICIVFLRTIEKLVVTNDGEDSNRRDRDQLSSRGVQLKSPLVGQSQPLPVNHERAAIVTGNADLFGRLVQRAA